MPSRPLDWVLVITLLALSSVSFTACNASGDPIAMCEGLAFDCTGIGGRDRSPPALPSYAVRQFELGVPFDEVGMTTINPAQSIVQVPCFIRQGLDLKPGPIREFAVGVAEVRCRRPTKLTLSVYLTKGNDIFPQEVVAQQTLNPPGAVTQLKAEAKFPLDASTQRYCTYSFLTAVGTSGIPVYFQSKDPADLRSCQWW